MAYHALMLTAHKHQYLALVQSLTLPASIAHLNQAFRLGPCPLCLAKRVLIVLVTDVCLAAVASALALAKMQLSATRCTVLYVSEYTFAVLRVLHSA